LSTEISWISAFVCVAIDAATADVSSAITGVSCELLTSPNSTSE
jgi:hypothetical protein